MTLLRRLILIVALLAPRLSRQPSWSSPRNRIRAAKRCALDEADDLAFAVDGDLKVGPSVGELGMTGGEEGLAVGILMVQARCCAFHLARGQAWRRTSTSWGDSRQTVPLPWSHPIRHCSDSRASVGRL